MTRLSTLIAACLLGSFAAVPTLAQPFEALTPERQAAELGRGLNILGYDPIWSDKKPTRFNEGHFRAIRDAGFRSVRINMPAFLHMDAQNRANADWLSMLDWAIDTALAHDLSVIIDDHDYVECAASFPTCRIKLMALWRQLSERYASRSPKLVFELLNEPNGAVNAANWNTLIAELLGIIRQTNPRRNIVIGPADWNNFRRLPDLVLPDADRHIIASFHYYDPMRFTHQGASWSPETKELSGISWGDAAERRRLELDFDAVQEWSQTHGRPILLGEFGAFDAADWKSRTDYTSAVARAAEMRGWAWAYWQFDINFAAFDMARNSWVQPILQALVPP